MKSNRVNYLVVGTFVLAIVTGLIVSVALLTGRTGTADEYHAIYKNVTGIKFGTQVLYEGYPVGQVEEITPEPGEVGMRFRVDFSVTEGWLIPDDSFAEITASGLLAAITINITAGDSPTAHQPGAEVKGREAPNIMAVVSSVAADVSNLTESSVRPLLDNINRSVDTLGAILEDEGRGLIVDLRTLAREISIRMPQIAEDIQAFTSRTPQIAENIEVFTEKMNEASDRIRSLLTDENRDAIAGFITKMDATAGNFQQLTEDLELTRAKIDNLLETVETVITDNRLDIDQSIVDMRYVVDSMSRNVDTINQNLEGASRNMYEFSRRIRQNPGLLLGGTPPVDKAGGRGASGSEEN